MAALPARLGLGPFSGPKSATLYYMQVIDSVGKLLDATYLVQRSGNRLDLIMESRSGRSGGNPGRNSDYNPALTLLLERLGDLKATMLDAWVDSGRTQALHIPEEGRRTIRAPIRLDEVDDIDALRVQIGRAQAEIAQASGAATGGNRTKRIRLRLDVPGYRPDQANDLADLLALPMRKLSAPREIVDRLDAFADQVPIGQDYANPVAELDGDLDRIIQARQRTEQNRLRTALFADRTAASCDLCGREFPVELLVAAHIKQRSQCSNLERQDIANVVMSACRFGCDELFERGYISVDHDGAIILSDTVRSSEHVNVYARQHLADRIFGRSMSGSRAYFAWHRANKFGGEGRPDIVAEAAVGS